MDYNDLIVCKKKYCDQYKGEECFIAEPDDLLVVSVNGTYYVVSENETKAVFIDRLNRGKIANKNLFAEEISKFDYEKGVEY